MDFFTKPFVKTIRFPTKKKYNIIKNNRKCIHHIPPSARRNLYLNYMLKHIFSKDMRYRDLKSYYIQYKYLIS